MEKWHASIERVAAWKPRQLVMTHFGASNDVDAQLSELAERLDAFAAIARDSDRESFIERVRAEVAERMDPETAAAYEQAAPPGPAIRRPRALLAQAVRGGALGLRAPDKAILSPDVADG